MRSLHPLLRCGHGSSDVSAVVRRRDRHCPLDVTPSWRAGRVARNALGVVASVVLSAACCCHSPHWRDRELQRVVERDPVGSTVRIVRCRPKPHERRPRADAGRRVIARHAAPVSPTAAHGRGQEAGGTWPKQYTCSKGIQPDCFQGSAMYRGADVASRRSQQASAVISQSSRARMFAPPLPSRRSACTRLLAVTVQSGRTARRLQAGRTIGDLDSASSRE